MGGPQEGDRQRGGEKRKCLQKKGKRAVDKNEKENLCPYRTLVGKEDEKITNRWEYRVTSAVNEVNTGHRAKAASESGSHTDEVWKGCLP